MVRDGVVVGRGVTAPGGRPHAEPIALAQAGEAARGGTLVVTLEPCCHLGRGRPCVEAVIAAGIARVVVACRDPDPRVAGQGIAALREAGLTVEVGIRADEARRDHRGHIRRVIDARPSLTLKLAETADGFAAAPPGTPRLMITGPVANGWVHVARSMHDAVLVGDKTARADDPLLTVRLPGLADRAPLRVVFDRHAALDPAARLAGSAGRTPLLLVTGPDIDADRRAALRERGVELAAAPLQPDGRLDLGAALRLLAGRGITRLFCEGGPRLAGSLLAADLVDELDLLTGPDRLAAAGKLALDGPARTLLTDPARFHLAEDRPLGVDRLRRYERITPCSPD